MELSEHRSYLQRLAYRMLGTLEDAEEVVQETMVRALERRPDEDRPLRPWLTRVAMNLSRDRLRRRKRAPWRGVWLPEPVEDPGPDAVVEAGRMASYAWMVALEVLTPSQRAVVVLREVFEHDAATTAEILQTTPASVRAMHARARRALARPVETSAAAHNRAFQKLLTALYSGDESLLAEVMLPDVRYVSDANGRYQAAGIPVMGRDRVVRLLLGLSKGLDADTDVGFVPVNGGIAMVVRRRAPQRRQSPVAATMLELDEEGRIVTMYTQLLPEKLRVLTEA